MIRRLDPSDPADRVQIARNAAVLGIVVPLLVAVLLTAVAIWHPAVAFRVAGVVLACLFLLNAVFKFLLYRRHAAGQPFAVEVTVGRRSVLDRRTTLCLFAAVVGMLILAAGGKLHGTAGAWFLPGSHDVAAVLLGILGALVMIGAAVGVVSSRFRRSNGD